MARHAPTLQLIYRKALHGPCFKRNELIRHVCNRNCAKKLSSLHLCNQYCTPQLFTQKLPAQRAKNNLNYQFDRLQRPRSEPILQLNSSTWSMLAKIQFTNSNHPRKHKNLIIIFCHHLQARNDTKLVYLHTSQVRKRIVHRRILIRQAQPLGTLLLRGNRDQPQAGALAR